MNPKKLLTDDDAVSPVIGVILMVAITVILAAVIASFVLGLGNSTNTTPAADFDFDYNNGTSDELTIAHETGDTIDGERVSLVIDGAKNTSAPGNSTEYTGNGFGSGDISSGSSVTLTASDFEDSGNGNEVANLSLAGATIKVTWKSEDQESSSTLGEYTVPSN